MKKEDITVFVTEEVARDLLPPRDKNGNKGSFGKVVVIAGSEKYPGAMHLCLESALRGGAGYTVLMADSGVAEAAIEKFPEAILKNIPPYSDMNDNGIRELAEYTSGAAVVIGCGCGVEKGVFKLLCAILSVEGGPVVVDADAINSVARYSENARDLFRSSKRQVVLTPHPLEASRLFRLSVAEIESDRDRIASSLAEDHGVTLLLKGSATVITDGKLTYINTSGSSALAKGGSGDCLAGLIGSMLAFGGKEVVRTAALCAYIHGRAGDTLEREYSNFGVTPSDLPRQMAREIALLCK